MTAKGKINASKVQSGHRIIVKDGFDADTARRAEVAVSATTGHRIEGEKATAVIVDDPVVQGARERTGSAVVALLEHVWSRIQEDHSELPDVVIVTGSGIAPGGSKWGHFRPEGWKAESGNQHEMFIAGEALAKGGKQVVQTMLHEAAHTLAKVRGIKDTSRQGRWHSRAFATLAEELGMEHKGAQADKSHGYSFATMTEETLTKHADLIADLDREISLTCHLPGWLGGEDREGGERITGRPTGGGAASGPTKLTCTCDDPTIIRASKKVAESLTVRCDVCDSWFLDRS